MFAAYILFGGVLAGVCFDKRSKFVVLLVAPWPELWMKITKNVSFQF